MTPDEPNKDGGEVLTKEASSSTENTFANEPGDNDNIKKDSEGAEIKKEERRPSAAASSTVGKEQVAPVVGRQAMTNLEQDPAIPSYLRRQTRQSQNGGGNELGSISTHSKRGGVELPPAVVKTSSPEAVEAPLDEADVIASRSPSCWRRWWCPILLVVLLLAGAAVAIPLVLLDSSSSDGESADVPGAASSSDDTNSGNPNAEPVEPEVIAGGVPSALDTTLMDPLAFATFHSVTYGWMAQGGCQAVQWSNLTLSCDAEEAADRKTTVAVLDIPASSNLVCERVAGERNRIHCRAPPGATTQASGTILVGCASNVANEDSNIALHVAMDASTVSECQQQPTTTTEPGVVRVQGNAFQWVSLARFCVKQGTSHLFDIWPIQPCAQGHEVLLPQDGANLGVPLSLRPQSFCTSWSQCEAAGTENVTCRAETEPLQVSDPSNRFRQCAYRKNTALRQEFWVYDMDGMWQLTNETYYDSYAIDQVLPAAIQAKLQQQQQP